MVQQRLNEPDNPSFQPGLLSQHASMPAASASRSRQARPDRSMSGWQQGKRCRCRNSRVWPTVSWPDSQTMARAGARKWALGQPGTGRHRSHEGQSKPTIPHRIRHRQTHILSPTHPPTATLLYGLTGQSSSAAAPPLLRSTVKATTGRHSGNSPRSISSPSRHSSTNMLISRID